MKNRIISIFLAIMMMLGMVIAPSPAYALTKDGESPKNEVDFSIEEIDGQVYKAINFEDVARKDTNTFKFFSTQSLRRLGGAYTTSTPTTKPDVGNYYVNVDVDDFFFKDDALGFEMNLYVQDRASKKIIGKTQKITITGKYKFERTKNWDDTKTYNVSDWQMIFRPDLSYDIRIKRSEGGSFENNNVDFRVAPLATSIYKAEYFTTNGKIPTVNAKRVLVDNQSSKVELNQNNLAADEYYSFAVSDNIYGTAWYKGKKINITKYGTDQKTSLQVSNQKGADRVKMYIDDPNVANPNPTPYDLTGLTRGPGKFTQNNTTYHYLVTGGFNDPHIFTFREELQVKFDPNGGKWTGAESGKETEVKSYPIGHSMKLNEAWGDITAITAPGTDAITPPEVKQNNQTVTNNFLGWNTDSKASTALSETDLNNLQFTEPETTLYAIYSQQNDGKAKVDYIDNSTGKTITIGENDKIAGQTYPTEKEGAVNTAIPANVFDKDSAPKILGYKFNRFELQPTDGKYTAAGTSTIKIYYDKVADVVPGTDPETNKPNPKPDGYVTVTFQPGTNGTLTGETTYYVNPKAGKTNADVTEPTIKANTGFKVADPKWKPDFVAATEIKADATYTAQYTKLDDVVNGHDENGNVVPKPDGYKTVTFDLDGKGTTTNETVFYVNPEKAVTLNPPTVKGIKGYTIKEGKEAWNPELPTTATKYTEDKTFVAQYTFSSISDTEVEGFNKVTFKPGDHGTLTEKSVWVQPNTLVDISDKAPIVTANTGYSHIGWKPGLIGKFDNNSEVVAQYSSSISNEPIPGWSEILFNSGEHGRFNNGTRNVVWVDPNAEVKLDFMTARIVPYINYSFVNWQAEDNSLTDLKTPTKYANNAVFTGTYKPDVSYTNGDIEINFKPGEHGKFADGAKTKIYVTKDKLVDLTEFAPTVIPNQGYGHSGWEPALKGTFTQATDIIAQYKPGTFNKDKVKEIIVLGPNKMGYGVGEKLDLTGLKVIVIDDAGLQETYDGVDAIKTAGFNIEPADKTVLDMDDNGKHIVVTKGVDPDKVIGQSQTTLTIHENKSAKAEDVKALNQNIEENGKVTDKPKTTTTVTGKATPGSTVSIKDENGNDITPQDGVTVDPTTGEFTAEVTKQDEGKKVQVIVKEAGKQDSDPAEATVARDADNNKIADKNEQTERPAAVASNKGKAPKFTSIEVKTEPGAIITVKAYVPKAGSTTGEKELKDVVLENNKATSGDTFVVKATLDGKPLENGAEILVYAQNAPKTISNPQTTTVFNDFNEDGKPDGGKVDLNDVKEIQVIAPKKMSYTQGETLDGTGLKAVITDNKGGIEIFDYDNATGKFKDADGKEVPETIATVNEVSIKDLELTEAKHDGKAIDVKVGAMKGSTNQKLEIKQLQTPTPTIVFAANQNTVGSDGTTATQTPKATTTVKFTVVNKPTTVYVKYTDNGADKEETFEIKANDDATKTVELGVKLPVGAEVQVLAKDADKALSKPATANVVRDANNDGTADNKTPLDKAKIDDIKAGADKVLVTPPKGATELVISERDKNGDTPQGSTPITLTKDGSTWKTPDGTVIPEENGKLAIPKGTFRLDEYNVVEAEAKGDPDTTTPSKAFKTVGEAADTKAPAKPVVDPPIAGDTDVRVKTPAEPDAKTITVEITKQGAPGEDPTKETVVVTKGDDGKWKTPDGTEVTEENGKLVIPVPDLKKGDTVKVTTADDSGNPSEANEQTVIERQKLDSPEINPIKIGDKLVTGTALTNKGTANQFAASTVNIYIKDGNDYKLLKQGVGVNADGSYTYNHTEAFNDGEVIRVVANKPGMISSAAETTVGVDTSGLDKAIQDGKDALDPEKGGKNDGTPEDKKLKEAIKEGEDIKKKDPAPTQKDVDEAKDKIEKAIEEKKKADEDIQNLKDKIKEGEDRLKQDDVTGNNNTPKKPQEDIDALKKAVEDGKKALDTKDNKTITDATKTVEKAIDQINKERIAVGVDSLAVDMKTLEIKTSVPGATVKIKIDGVIIDTIKTDGYGTFSKGLEAALEEDQVIVLEASKPGYNDGIFRDTVY